MTPVAFTAEEVRQWLAYNMDKRDIAGRTTVREFVMTGVPAWGIVVKDAVATGVVNTVLLFIPPNSRTGERYDRSREVRATLVDASDPIVSSVQKAPYKSPDDVGFWENFMSDLERVGLPTPSEALGSIALIALGVGLIVAFRR